MTIIKECIDSFLTTKKKYYFEVIKIDIKAYLSFIDNNYDKEFLFFLENKLFDNSINFDEIKDALLFSSQLRYKRFIPLLEVIINKMDNIINICKLDNSSINIDNYIKRGSTDNLIKIKELISTIIEKEKQVSFKFIKFNVNIWIPYTQTNKIEDLYEIRKIIWICKTIEHEVDEDNIGLGDKIHNLGLELIKNNKLKGDKLTEFLGLEHAFYTENKIKYLEDENNKLKNKINDINNQISNIKSDIRGIKSDVNSLFTSKEIIIGKIEKVEDKINDINKEIYYIKFPPNQY